MHVEAKFENGHIAIEASIGTEDGSVDAHLEIRDIGDAYRLAKELIEAANQLRDQQMLDAHLSNIDYGGVMMEPRVLKLSGPYAIMAAERAVVSTLHMAIPKTFGDLIGSPVSQQALAQLVTALAQDNDAEPEDRGWLAMYTRTHAVIDPSEEASLDSGGFVLEYRRDNVRLAYRIVPVQR